jgi:hypothetical protein
MPLSKAYRDRERDILDKYALKQITRNEAGKLLTDLYQDYYEAHSSIRLATGAANETQ